MSIALVGLATEIAPALEYARSLGGRGWQAHPAQRAELPYQAMFEVATDDAEAASQIGDVGLYVIYRRVIKAPSSKPPDRVIASFGMVRHPDLSHRQADSHWRDTHGPLALINHRAMCDYEQLSVLATIAGTPLDGMAMCAFSSRADLSERFFNDDEARRVIAADVATFANPGRSLPRVVLTQSV